MGADSTMPKRTIKPAQSIPWPASDGQYRSAALRQKKQLRDAADKLDAGEALTEWERTRAAAIVRKFADEISTEQPNKRGSQKLQPFEVVMEYVGLVYAKGISKNAARGQLAEQWDVSEKAIKDAIKKYENAALVLSGRMVGKQSK